MKNLKFLLVVLSIFVISSCNDDEEILDTSYTSIPDSNFEAALEALGLDDISNDGQVPTEKIATVTSLDVSSKNISDLTGIQDFEALVDLDVSHNHLTGINVLLKTSNILLETLDCSQNQITSLVIESAPSLLSLNCIYNQITSLVIESVVPSLFSLDCRYNQITSLVTELAPSLVTLSCGYNQLTSLDVRKKYNAFWAVFA